ncbi:DUF1080 domain-containing protein [Solirubrobacter ginsenosidimutans]|uniref:DUF1080 domain-containing protein n=1 Tax=Solirubrobacter ginsenosidimutans TaxID=490573 RepID=A0A9X3S354_9ACTN|nr:DUF1080 domain-containing protein [Solirubrobacter ginsenosidimutans]MDA0161761.1 DUF1080 domain-containing protein [Solirubrobacter ginsenosidimutans]
MRRSTIAGWLAGAAIVAVPGVARAQYVAPPPDPGFHYIFDGSATGSDASFDKWAFAAGTAAQSRPASQGGQGQATLDTVEGSFLVGASPFGSYWYPVRTFGDAVLRIQYTVQNTPAATRNGGIMIRTPEIRYTGATTNDVLAQKPAGFNYDVCAGALPICNLTTPAPSTTYTFAGMPGPFPPPGTYSGAYCARSGTEDVSNLAGTGTLTVNGNANNHQHWTQVYCGHEIQINETLTGTGEFGGSDPIKTGSVYGFRNLNAKQSGTNQRLVKGVWHELEIRTIGQQYTVLVDGKMINQFDNSIPKIASRNGDPGTMARQFVRGYLGLQTHGGSDRISYREIQVKDVTPADIPVNTALPTVTGSGYQGNALTCNTGTWNAAAGTEYFVRWYRSNKVLPTNPRLRAPSQLDYWNVTTPSEPEYGNQDLTWLDSQIIGESATYMPTAADVGKALHCAVNANNGGATVWKTAAAPEILAATNAGTTPGGTVPATLSLTLGTPASFGPFTPGITKTYEAATTATVVSTAGDALLSVADPSPVATGHLVNGTFSLPQPLQGRARNSANTGTAYNNVGSSASPLNLLTYSGPISNDAVALQFSQLINATDALRTGSYAKTLTFTLSTTTP